MKIRKTISIVIITLVVLIHSVSWATEVRTYRNDKLGFEVSYLDSWDKATGPDNSAFFIKRKSKTEPSTFSVDVANFTADKEQVMQEMRSDKNQFIEKLRNRFPDAEIIERGDTYLGGWPAYLMAYSYTLRNIDFQMEVAAIQVICIKGGNFYVVSFESPASILEKTLKEFDATIATFNFR